MRLVLAEKPSVAADLARVMDPGARRAEGYLEGRSGMWTWALGHMAELAPPERYAPELAGRWRLALLPVVPERFVLRARKGRANQLAVIQRLLQGADEVVVATDAGREGEAIWEYIRELCAYSGPVLRLWLREGTPEAVRAAFAALRPPMVHLAAAARVRGQADWLVGMNATMALSARHGGLWSAGRVQTPTLALLVAREVEIRAFVAEDYWVVLADFSTPEGVAYRGRWFRGDHDRLHDAAEAQAVAAKVQGQDGEIVSSERRAAREAPPRLFNLTDLQRAANARHGFAAARTLAAAQALYERHKALTYPRTDSRHVGAATFGTFAERLRAAASPTWPPAAIAARLAGALPHPGPRVVDDSRVSDHHALLPTGRAVDLAALPPDERRVYELVVRRFLAALLPPASYADTEVVTEVAGERFRSRSRVLTVPGWREAEPPPATGRPAGPADGGPTEERDGTAEESGGNLQALRTGQPARCARARAETRQTQPPKRYTEASLLRAMETAGRLVDDEALAEAMRERGLGTPATRAEIIETLLKRAFVRREQKALIATPRGEQVVGLAPAELRDPATTGEWEHRLRRIERGEEDAAEFLRGIAALTRRIVADAAAQDRAPPTAAAEPAASLGSCPRCGAGIVEGRKGFGCVRWREADGGCRWVLWKEVAGKALTANQARELLAHGETRRAIRGFRSRAGAPFAARLQLDRETGRVRFLFDAASPARPSPAAAAPAASRPPRGRRAAAAGQAQPGAGRSARAGARGSPAGSPTAVPGERARPADARPQPRRSGPPRGPGARRGRA